MAPRGLGRQGHGGLSPAPWRVVARRSAGRGAAARDLVIDRGHRLLEDGEALDKLAIQQDVPPLAATAAGKDGDLAERSGLPLEMEREAEAAERGPRIAR